MRNIKLTIEYNGTHFHGWQRQAKNQRTVQDEIQKALKKIFGTDIKLTGSGRTDSGVHALGQVANFKTVAAMPVKNIRNALNAHLPKDIAILEAKDVSPTFHAQYSVKTKTYRYTLLNRDVRSAVNNAFCCQHAYKLNLPLMKREALALKGKHDFKSFQAIDPAKRGTLEKASTVRTIKRIEIKKSTDYIFIDIEADGFLYKMVRTIIGTLLAIGSGQMEKGSMKKILIGRNRALAGSTAPAQGLCLLKVNY